ncbi:MAG: zinc ribbon domain-containing protein [Candidatus Aenigmatarchaeota archaeon]
MKSGLVVLGILLMLGMFMFSNVLITPQQKQEAQLANSLCNSNVNILGFNIPIGQSVQSVSPDIAQKCQGASTLSSILSFETPAYLIGFVLLVLGLALGGRKEVIREVVRERNEKVEQEEPEEEEETPEENVKKKGVKYCSDCGNKIKVGEKFCGSCGKAVK